MNLRTVKKKFRQEVLVDSKSEYNSATVIVCRFVVLCAKASAGRCWAQRLVPKVLFPHTATLAQRRHNAPPAQPGGSRFLTSLIY